MSAELKRAIWRNQQRHKARRLLNRIRLRWFDYEDAGKLDKAKRIMRRLTEKIMVHAK